MLPSLISCQKNPHFPGLTQITHQLVSLLVCSVKHQCIIENSRDAFMSFNNEEHPSTTFKTQKNPQKAQGSFGTGQGMH